MIDQLLDTTDRPTPSRRAIIGAVWTAPVVVAASTAPAYAASSPVTLVFDTLSAYATDYDGSGAPTRTEVLIQVRREWTDRGSTVKSLTVSVPFPVTTATGTPATVVSGAGWKAGSVKGSSSSWSYSFTWSGALDNTVQATPQLTFRIDRPSGKRDPVPLTAYATATGTAGGSRTETVSI